MSDQCIFCEMVKEPQDNPTFIAEFEHSVAFVNFNQETYPGRAMLILKDHFDHLHETPTELQQAIVPEMSKLTKAVLKAFGGFRANHESLGNEVSHVHWHIIPRYRGDLNEGGPPLHVKPSRDLTDDECRTYAARIRAALKSI